MWSLKNCTSSFCNKHVKVSFTMSDILLKTSLRGCDGLKWHFPNVAFRARLHQAPHQRCDNSATTLMILFSLKTMELPVNELQPHSWVTSLFSMRTAFLASSLLSRNGKNLPFQYRFYLTHLKYICWSCVPEVDEGDEDVFSESWALDASVRR